MLTLLKLVIMSALLDPTAYLPVELTIDSVTPDEVPFRLTIDFQVVDEEGGMVYQRTYEKLITEYRESYSGVLKLRPELSPGLYELNSIVYIDNKPYMKFTQEFRVDDGVEVQYNVYETTSKELQFDVTIQNTGNSDMSIVLHASVFDALDNQIMEKKEVVSVSPEGSVEKSITIPLNKLESGKYKAVVGYSIVGNAEYYEEVGEVEFELENTLYNSLEKFMNNPTSLIIFAIIILSVFLLIKK